MLIFVGTGLILFSARLCMFVLSALNSSDPQWSLRFCRHWGLWQPLHVEAPRAAWLLLIQLAANAESPGWQSLGSRSPWSQAVLESYGSSVRLFRDAQLRLHVFLFTFIYIFISIFALYLLTGLSSIKTDTSVVETAYFLVHLFIV